MTAQPISLHAAAQLRGIGALRAEATIIAERAWQDMIKSLDLYRDTETRFDWVKSAYIEKYGDNSDTRMRLALNEDYKIAVADAPHFARRITAFATAYEAANVRLQEIDEYERDHFAGPHKT